MKRFFYYFIWSIAIALVVYAGLQLQQLLSEKAASEFEPRPLWIYIAIFPIIIGLLLRTPKFMLERKESRIGGFDWSKFLAVGVPAFIVLVLSILPLLPIENLIFSDEVYVQIDLLLFSSTTAQTIAGLVFGYTLLDSFKSEERGFQESTSDLFNAVMKFTPKG
ncbi:hypothetical protein KQ939_00695 [Planococcus sp. CP5-4]|uniref:hypothetical protein n=1 Tax=unclassified Planococcus (in: firmicutes) TaxID=2662419 RepID=UPI001C21699A|nr:MULTISPECIES: hypothetical protein [unclassified Planococcus (in: firmicutes)]MBU9673385.1 hypothetical protein [Planococcus sp. CP5-4_YE]MBV0908158.1 hypothetical protein [Planococcus sp. CP5-4_UN]MBW6062219.1 hypothetical protein [Planococcus sp. CP5-4]